MKVIYTNGYIYVRYHKSYENVCKLGKTFNIPKRDSQYKTGEHKSGYFELVFDVSVKKVCNIEKQLQKEFVKYHNQSDGGTEFYDREIINLIEIFFIKNEINYTKLTEEEINNLIFPAIKTDNKIKIENKKQNIEIIKTEPMTIYTPRKYQTKIINKAYDYFQEKNKGLLIIPCGVGKTLISLWIVKALDITTFIIGVPNILLLNQWVNVVDKLFPDYPYLIVKSDISVETIEKFCKKYKSKCIVITTYSSSHKIYQALNDNFVFKMKINDETHHLTTDDMDKTEDTKKFVQMLNIPCEKQLSLTATSKHIEKITEKEVSNDTLEYFGEVIDRKCLLWAINKNIVCDYVIQTIITNEEKMEEHLIKFNITEDKNKRLFLSSFISLKSIFDQHSHHLLIYSNNKENSIILIKYIKMLLKNNYFNISDLYYSHYNSDMTHSQQQEILNKYNEAPFGIITCVYCLGEGYDNKKIDGVVFSENMSSNIRIVQSALRASRKNEDEPDKITKIILPIKDDLFDSENSPDLKKVREVIYQMGLEDTTIMQKIRVFTTEIKKCGTFVRQNKQSADLYIDYDTELTEKLKIRTVKRVSLGITYEKSKAIIADKNLLSKESYYELCDKDCRLTKEPEIIFKHQFTNWVDYLNIERIYYDLEECKSKIAYYFSLYPDIKKDFIELILVCEKLCSLDKLFPPLGLWADYYNVNDLSLILFANKKRFISI